MSAIIVGRDSVAVVKKSCCFVAVSKGCTFSVVNVTVSVEIVEVAGIVGVVVAVGEKVQFIANEEVEAVVGVDRNQFRWAFFLRFSVESFRWVFRLNLSMGFHVGIFR